MIGLVLCVLAFAITRAQARRSPGAGFGALLVVGYVYGVLRARIGDAGSHFLFDAALFGLYAGTFTGPRSPAETEALRFRGRAAVGWTVALIAWPLVCMAYSPLSAVAQPWVIQLVGLRDAVFMIPCIIVGARMKREDMDTLAPIVAVLNLIALGFGLYEYANGIESVFPRNQETLLMYQSMDVLGASGFYYRIPASFLSSHAYGGTMVISVPFVTHGFESGGRTKMLCWAGFGAAGAGVFLCGARVPVVLLVLATVYVVALTQKRASTFFAFGAATAVIAYLVTTVDRFQRFTTLGDTGMLRGRFSMSMNMSFFDVLTQYPLGAGLASGAGTSIPAFLMDTPGLHAQFGIENEYARILLEEGIVGLLLWLVFFAASTFNRAKVHQGSPMASTYLHGIAALMWLTAPIGTGLLYSIPISPIFYLALGMRIAQPVTPRVAEPVRRGNKRPREMAAAVGQPLGLSRSSQ